MTGISQLEKAGKSVGNLQTTLQDLQPKLAENVIAVTETSAQVIKEKEEIENFEEIVLTDQEAADVKV